MVPLKLLLFKSNKPTSPLFPHATPVQITEFVPQGNDRAVSPLQSQPVNDGDADVAAVGYIVGAKAVGDTEENVEEEGDGVEAFVGFDGQLAIPNLNAQRALASISCWTDPVGANLGFAFGRSGVAATELIASE